jgi:hypothetical protein
VSVCGNLPQVKEHRMDGVGYFAGHSPELGRSQLEQRNHPIHLAGEYDFQYKRKC